MSLTKTELVEKIGSSDDLFNALDVVLPDSISESNVERACRNVTKIVLDQLASLAQTELSEGETFTVPGVARVEYRYTAPKKKGERWKKGDEYEDRFDDNAKKMRETDSPPVAAKVVMRANPVIPVARLKPKRDPESQKAFFASTAGKNIIKRGK